MFAVYSYMAETDEAINLVEGERLYILGKSFISLFHLSLFTTIFTETCLLIFFKFRNSQSRLVVR